MRMPAIFSKWSQILAEDESFLDKFAKQMMDENKEVALRTIF
jgi:hypothetical protein